MATRTLPPEWEIYFRTELIRELNQHWQLYWVLKQPSLFEFKIERNWEWDAFEVDSAVATRLSELERWLEARSGWHRHRWLRGISWKNPWRIGETDWQRALRREHQREIAQALNHFPDVDPAALVRRVPISVWLILTPSFFRRSPMQRQRAQPRPVRVRVLPPGPLLLKAEIGTAGCADKRR